MFVGKTDSFLAEFLLVDFVFGFEVFNQRLLAAIDPAGEKGQNELEVEVFHFEFALVERLGEALKI
ncbi:MAG: hypothetical protein JXA30_07355 [Deltaproteobacteria bacterium]|nr:hypothetical protein [Deltaproteobacteria bacterium]